MADSTVSHAGQQSFSISTGNSHDSFNSNSVARYHGLIRQSYVKVFRKDLMQLFSYIFSVAPPVPILHKIMTVVRVLQFLCPCLCPSYMNFWVPGTIQQTTINVLSVFFYLIPPSADAQAGKILVYIYIVLSILVLALVFGSSIYFKKNAKLHNIIISFISFYFSTVGYFLHPIACYLVSRSIGIIVGPSSSSISYSQGSIIEISITAAFTYLLTIINSWIVLEITSQTMIFRPDSLMSVTSLPKNIIYGMTIITNIFFGFGAFQDKIAQTVFLALSVACYVVSSCSVFLHGGFIHKYISNLILSSSITGSCFTLLILICILINQESDLIFIFAFIIFFILVTISVHFFLNWRLKRQLNILDLISDDQNNFELVKSPNSFLNLCVAGFNTAHPACLELNIFMQAIDRWPREPIVWYMFAKFIAIYPEETQTLAWIFHNVTSMKLKGSSIRCIKEQSLSISRQREPNLSAELKNKLNVISKQVQSTKHKLRHVWDVVIQGNIGEVETSTKRALNAIDQTDADFKHLFRQFPNNRFVTRSYAKFLLDITADHTLSNQMLEKTRLLQRGIQVNNDQTHELGIATFKNLPEHIKRQRNDPQNGNTYCNTINDTYCNTINDTYCNTII
ncbi:hypothetical protein TRFO_21604 [Tritrichomonas foetus]|uniref:Uncharacterized protein n=1 Tax=Tritrichomonas foetus TaxID=1144522 RepID=A0A1J4KDN3_9EUKA|nr:hypothetical protein TRFO_21604 [Tritrichomonas foetus]|eukprot:OHT09545.1 hypothetical protein TRFO_21604 [Tritrichomonas foetus]